MIFGSVILSSFAGLVGFVIALATGNSFLASIAIYSGVGTVGLAACILWTVTAPFLTQSGEIELHRGGHRASET